PWSGECPRRSRPPCRSPIPRRPAQLWQPGRTWTLPGTRVQDHGDEISVTSNTSSEFGGMPLPDGGLAPYAWLAGISMRRVPPGFIPTMPSAKPGIRCDESAVVERLPDLSEG